MLMIAQDTHRSNQLMTLVDYFSSSDLHAAFFGTLHSVYVHPLTTAHYEFRFKLNHF